MRIKRASAVAAASIFLSFGLVRHSLASDLPQDPACQDQPAYTSVENILLLDRTTNADQSARDRFRDGVVRILENQAYAGHLTVEEVRENEIAAEKLGEGCLDALTPPVLTSPKAPSLWTQILSFFLRLWHRLFPTKPSQEGASRNILRAQDIAADRQATINFVSPLIEQNHPTSRDTEITQSLVAALQTNCSNRKACNVFIYSDLLDSATRRSLKGSENMRQSGRTRAASLLREYRPELRGTVLAIKVWGFGRADDAPGSALSDEYRMAVRIYWEGFFDVVKANAEGGSSSQISGMY